MRQASVEEIREAIKGWPEQPGLDQELVALWIQNQPLVNVRDAANLERFDIEKVVTALPIGWYPTEESPPVFITYIDDLDDEAGEWCDSCEQYGIEHCEVCGDPVDACPGHPGITINGVPIQDAIPPQHARGLKALWQFVDESEAEAEQRQAEDDTPRIAGDVVTPDEAATEHVRVIGCVIGALDTLGNATTDPTVMPLFDSLVQWVRNQEPRMAVETAANNIGFDLSNIMDGEF